MKSTDWSLWGHFSQISYLDSQHLQLSEDGGSEVKSNEKPTWQDAVRSNTLHMLTCYARSTAAQVLRRGSRGGWKYSTVCEWESPRVATTWAHRTRQPRELAKQDGEITCARLAINVSVCLRLKPHKNIESGHTWGSTHAPLELWVVARGRLGSAAC